MKRLMKVLAKFLGFAEPEPVRRVNQWRFS